RRHDRRPQRACHDACARPPPCRPRYGTVPLSAAGRWRRHALLRGRDRRGRLAARPGRWLLLRPAPGADFDAKGECGMTRGLAILLLLVALAICSAIAGCVDEHAR